MKAIILAAGMGSRLKDILNGDPKPLFKIGGRSLLEYSLEALSKNGISEVVLATGFGEDQIIKKIGKQFNGMRVRYAKNKAYETTGSMHSLYIALKKPEDCLVLDGDIIYDTQFIKDIIGSKMQNCVAVTNCCGSGDEVYVVLDKESKVVYLGKNLPKSKETFEFTGISKFSKDYLKIMFDLHEKRMQSQTTGEYYEDCAFRASELVPWYGINMAHLRWSEIDKKEDIQRATEVLENIS
jgi:L-glutamine-phosphate cytidylyltransferase